MADERADEPRYFTAQEHGEIFEKEYHHNLRRSTARRNEDGSLTVFQAYELLLNPHNLDDLHFFGLKAAAAGYRSVIGPVALEVIPPPWESPKPRVSVNFILEAPANQPEQQLKSIREEIDERHRLSDKLRDQAKAVAPKGNRAPGMISHLAFEGKIREISDINTLPDEALIGAWGVTSRGIPILRAFATQYFSTPEQSQ